MGRKVRAAKASLVAAFMAAGGAAAAKTVAAAPPSGAQTSSGTVNWGDPLVRFLKLDGFPDSMKIDNVSPLNQYYKEALISDASEMYLKYEEPTSGLLALYVKDHPSLTGVLIGLEQWNKDQNTEALVAYLKVEGLMDAYFKFEDFFGGLQAVGRDEKTSALDYFFKLTGIRSLPAVQDSAGASG